MANFTAFPKQMQGYWLYHYFPEMLERSWSQMPGETRVLEALRAAGFAGPKIVPFEVNEELEDLFLYAGEQRPLLYLDERVQKNISSFSIHCSPSELKQG